jgi:hypothetical protein
MPVCRSAGLTVRLPGDNGNRLKAEPNHASAFPPVFRLNRLRKITEPRISVC